MAKSTPGKKKTDGGTRIMPCSCKHEFQDGRYGVGRRVHNPTTKGYRCTVCGKNKE